MKTLTIDAETKDPYIGEGLGAGWPYPGDKFKVLGFSLKYNDAETKYILPEDNHEAHSEYKAMKQYLSFREYENDTYIIMHNASYDLGCLIRLGTDIRHLNVIDTEVMSRLFDSSLMSHALDPLAKKYLKHKKDNAALIEAIREAELVPYTIKHHELLTKYCKASDESLKETLQEGIDKSEKLWQVKALKWAKSNMDILQDKCYDAVEQYANMDVDLTYQLFKYFLDNCESKGWTREEFLKLTVKYSNVSKITCSYRERGVRVDLKRCREILQELQPKICGLYDEVYKLAGEEFNLKSPIDMPRVFDKLGIEYPRTETGNASITSPWMEKQTHPICDAIIKARKYKNISDNFIQKILDMQPMCLGKEQEEVDNLDYGMLYPELNLLRARTGRFSMSSPNCFDKETEILTDSGWKYFKDLKPENKVAQYDKGEISFVHPTDYITKKEKYIYDIQTESGQINMSVTEDHRLLLRSRKGVLSDHTVSTYKEDHQQIAAGIYNSQLDLTSVNLDLIFAIQADGSLTKYGVDFCFTKQRKIDRFNDRIATLSPMKSDASRYRCLIPYRDIPDYVWKYVDKDTKKFTSNIVELAHEGVLDHFMFWDGDYTRLAEWKSKHKSDCDNVQSMLALSGYRAFLSTHVVDNKTYHVVRVCGKDYSWTTNRTIEKREYNDLVYCVSVPSSYIVTRRNRSVAITGQCQQIPSRDEYLAPLCRSIFVAHEGETIYSLDYANQEGRLQIHYANRLKCEGASLLVEEFKADPNFDMHQKVADMVGISRGEAKAVNLGISYGMGITKLAKGLGITDEEAKEIREKYNTLAPYLNQLNKFCMNTMKSRNFIKTIGGRRSACDPPFYKGGDRITFEYKALNKLIQGSAADQTIESMILAYEKGIPVLFPVHDQFLISGTKEQAVELTNIMESAIILDIPVVVDVDLDGGFRWSEAGH